MRQLTVGVSDSPHVTHPFTSDCEILYLDILCLLNCFLSARFGRQAVRICRQALPLEYQTFDQIVSCNGDEKDVQRESQDKSLFEDRAKNYQLRDARPCPAYDECENRAQPHAFLHKCGTDRNNGLCPNIHGNNDNCLRTRTRKPHGFHPTN